MASASTDAEGLVLEIADNGVGMPPGAKDKIVALFSQHDSSLTRKHEGAGLGLTFVSKVAGQHGGKLHISSHLGQGTVITLTFPLAPMAIREVA